MIIDKNKRRLFKGNLHTHTTNSDGKKLPEETISIYRSKGYDFLSLTDHWVLSETVENDDFLLISGCEYNTGRTAQEGIYHIVGVGFSSKPSLLNDNPPVQEIIDEINKNDGIAILAHPAWSMSRPEELFKLWGICGAEIYNTASAAPWNCRPYSGLIMDDLAARGKPIGCMAADDTHWYEGDEARSYLLVEAQSLSRKDILQAIKDGKYYATQGPMFNISIGNGEVTVSCEPGEDGDEICEVVFFTDTVYVPDRVTYGQNLHEAHYKIKPTDTFVRVEVIDVLGNVGWSSYYMV